MKFAILALVLFVCLQSGELAQNVLDLGPSFNFKDIPTWQPSEELKRNFPYYIAGVDKESRPLFICEGGRWNFRKAVDAGGNEYEQMRRQVAKGIFNVLESLNGGINELALAPGGSPLLYGEEQELPDGVGWIIDMEGFDFVQLGSPRTLLFFVDVARLLAKVSDSISYAYLINTNFAVETLLNIMKPTLGSFAEKLEVAGTNKARWSQMLLKRVSKDQLPSWYGGSKKFKPVAFYGK